MHQPILWVAFICGVLALLLLDLGLINRKSHVVSLREAAIWCAVWVGLAIIFNIGIYYWYGHNAALEFLTGYLIEESLSVDNIFVFILLFQYFRVPPEHQHRVLFWGIIGAIVMRLSLILVGHALITNFHWVIYIFGAFLVFTGIKLFFHQDDEVHPENNPVLILFRKFFNMPPGMYRFASSKRRSDVDRFKRRTPSSNWPQM